MFRVVLNDGSVRIGVWKALRFQLATVCVEEYEIKLISDYFKGVTTSIRGRERERERERERLLQGDHHTNRKEPNLGLG